MLESYVNIPAYFLCIKSSLQFAFAYIYFNIIGLCLVSGFYCLGLSVTTTSLHVNKDLCLTLINTLAV